MDEISLDIEIDILEQNELSPIECVTRELFRIYEPFCYRRSYGRGAGYPLNACPTDAPDQNGLLCYPKCRDGYVGVGPVCWQDCAPLTAVGIFCVGSNDLADLKTSYDIIFVRKSYGRGAGSPMVCSSQYEQDGALCYDYCDKRYYGVGPVCWQYCPSSQPTSCGFGCSITSADCTKTIIDMFLALTSAAMGIMRLKIVRSLIETIINNSIGSAANNDWISVTGNMSTLSNSFAEKIVSDVSKNCDTWSTDTLESATKNASFLLTAAAFNDISILRPFLKRFDITGIIIAFDHALCNLRDDFFD